MKQRHTNISLNYYNSVIVLAFLYILSKIELFYSNSTLSGIIDVLQWPFLLYIASSLIESKIKKKYIKTVIATATVVIVFFISYRNSGLANIFKFAVIIIAAKKLKNYEIFRSVRNLYSVTVIITFILALLHIIPSNVVRRGFFTYGFVHSNVLAMFVFAIVCCDLLVTKGKVSLKRYLLYIVILVVTIFLTDCRSVATGLLIILMMILVFRLAKDVFLKNKILHVLICSVSIVLTIISLYMAYNFNYNNPLMVMLDTLSSTRIYLAHRLTVNYTLTLFGQDCGSSLMENAYLTVFFAWGIIPGIITVLFYCYAIHIAIMRKHYNVVSCLIGFAVQGLFEGSTLELFLNLAMLTPFIRISDSFTEAFLIKKKDKKLKHYEGLYDYRADNT